MHSVAKSTASSLPFIGGMTRGLVKRAHHTAVLSAQSRCGCSGRWPRARAPCTGTRALPRGTPARCGPGPAWRASRWRWRGGPPATTTGGARPGSRSTAGQRRPAQPCCVHNMLTSTVQVHSCTGLRHISASQPLLSMPLWSLRMAEVPSHHSRWRANYLLMMRCCWTYRR